MIIGIAGTLGAGKGTVVEYLKSKGFAHYSSSATLITMLKERGLPLDRTHMSALAEELINSTPGGILGISLERAREAGNENVVLEAIHRQSEADFVRQNGGKILGVDADIKTRYERVHARGDGTKDQVSFEQFVADSKREDEGKGTVSSNINAVIASADTVVTNNGTIEELQAAVEHALSKLKL